MTPECYFKDAHENTVWAGGCDGPMFKEKSYFHDGTSRYACEYHAKITEDRWPQHHFVKVEPIKAGK